MKQPYDIQEIKARQKQLRVEAKVLLPIVFVHPVFQREVRLSMAGIKEWLNQPHRHYAAKNEALLTLPSMFVTSEYVGATPDPKRRPDIKCSHLFKTQIANDDSWIIVNEMQWGVCYIHSISDYLPINDKQAI